MTSDRLALQKRKRLLDVLWLSTLLVIYLALAASWFLRAIEIDLAPIAWLLFAYAATYLAVTRGLERLRPRGLRAALALLQLAGIAILGAVWHLAGGVQNPLFLLAFVLPVVISVLAVESWQTYLLAFAAIIVVLGIAWLESSALRAYVLQLGLPVQGLVAFFGDSRPAPPAFSDLRAPPAYLFVALELFVVLMTAIAAAATTLSVPREPTPPPGLAERALAASKTPAVVVDTTNGAVVAASDSLRRGWLLGPEDVAGKSFQDLVDFADPAAVAALLEHGGELPLATYRIGPERRVARIKAHGFEHQGSRYAQVVIEDLSELNYLRAALDGAGEPWLVIGPEQRLVYFNRPAEEALGTLYLGLEATTALAAVERPAAYGGPAAWWPSAAGDDEPVPLVLGGRAYRGYAIVSHDGGEELVLLRLRPAEEAT